MNQARLTLSVLVLVAAFVTIRLAPLVLLPVILTGLVAHAFGSGGWRQTVRQALPVGLFGATVVALQWFNGHIDLVLPLRTVAFCLLSTLAVRVTPWAWITGRISPHSPFYLPELFLIFVRHFAEILLEETRRMLQARALVAPSLWGPGGLSSLVHALASIVRRTLTRAERFYAAQSLTGIVR
jgi:hypothetical protein